MAIVQENALKLLQYFYDHTRNGNTRRRLQDAASQTAVFFPDAIGAARYLDEKGLVSARWLAGAEAASMIMISAYGIDRIEEGQRSPNAPLRDFPSVTYNTTILHNVGSAAIQQGVTGSSLTQNVTYSEANKADFAKLANLLETHIQQLGLDAPAQRKVLAQVATIRAQLQDEPDPTILQKVGKVLRSVTEATIAGLIAAGVQPAVWHFVQVTIATLATL